MQCSHISHAAMHFSGYRGKRAAGLGTTPGTQPSACTITCPRVESKTRQHCVLKLTCGFLSALQALQLTAQQNSDMSFVRVQYCCSLGVFVTREAFLSLGFLQYLVYLEDCVWARISPAGSEQICSQREQARGDFALRTVLLIITKLVRGDSGTSLIGDVTLLLHSWWQREKNIPKRKESQRKSG